MNVALYIARRYLFYRSGAVKSGHKTGVDNKSKVRSNGNRNVINIISGIAAVGVAIGSLAMIVVLSAFNGLESLVADLYTTVDPDLRIEPIKGKVFSMDSFSIDQVAKWEEVKGVAPVLEETVFLQFDDQQNIVTIRGIPESYLPHLALDSHLIEGDLSFKHSGVEGAVIGYGIADNLNLFVRDGVETIRVFAAKRDGINSMNPENKFVSKRILPVGIVALNPEFDFKFMYTSYAFAEDLLQYENEASYLDFTLNEGVSVSDFKEKLVAHFGSSFSVKTRIELNDVIYKTNATEKWVTFFILCFILVVATFNLLGSLAMLIIEKRRDIALLRSVGASISEVRKLFMYEGMMITVLGSSIGLGVGVTIILLQQFVGFFPLENGIVEFYPVELELLDLLSVVLVTLSIGLCASYIPVRVLLRSSKLQVIATS